MAISAPGDLTGYNWGMDALSAYTDAGSTLASTDGALVQQLNDTSGNGRHATQATGINKPTWCMVGGKAAIRFDNRTSATDPSNGNIKSLTTSSFLDATYDTAFTVYIVWEYHSGSQLKVALAANGTNLFLAQETNSLQPRIDAFTGALASSGSNRYHNFDGANKIIVCVRYNGTSKKIRVVSPDAGVDAETTYTTSGNLGFTGPIKLGDTIAGGFAWRGFIYGAHLYKAYHSDSDVQLMVDYLNTRHCGEPVATNGTTGSGVNKLVCDGNSMTFGTGATPGVNDYPTQLAALLGGSWTVVNKGVPSQTSGDMMLDAETEIDTLYDPTASKNYCISWEGTNDLYFGQSPAQSARRLRDYNLRRRYKGFQKVFALSVLSRSDASTPGTFNTSRATLNATLATSSGATRVIRLDQDPRIGDNGDELDTNFFNADKVHMIGAGYTVVAGDIINQANLKGPARAMLLGVG